MNCSNHNFLSVTERRTETEILSGYIEGPRNMKQVQKACSTTDVELIRHKLNKRSYSDEEFGDSSKIYKRNELKDEVLGWIDVYNEQSKVKLLREKMQKLAEKMKKPGEEERIRMKIEKYLKGVPSKSDCVDDRIELRRQLPNYIIRRLKKMYTKSEESNLTKIESPKFYRIIKRTVMDWLVKIPIKRQDFLGRTTKREDILNYLTGKLKSVIKDRPNSDKEYKNVLKSSITNVMDSLPIISGNRFNNCKVADDLANDIFNISTTFHNRHVQPILRELKEFIAGELDYLIENLHITMNTMRLKYLEAELVDALNGIDNIDDVHADDVIYIFRDIGKIPVYKARYMADTILNDYKDYFFRNVNNSTDIIPSNNYSVYQNSISVPLYYDKSCINQLIDEIYDWLHDLPVDLCVTKSLNQQLINKLAEKIARGLSIGDPEVIDKEVNIWAEKIFKGGLHRNLERQLKDRLTNVLYEEIEVNKDPKHERLVMRRYEDIIDEWIDKGLIEKRKESSFFNIRNERIHDLAIRLYNIKLTLNKSNEIVASKLQDEILDWVNTLPLHLVNTQCNMDILMASLVKNIQACDTTDMKNVEATAKLDISQLEEALLDWLKKLPFYKDKSSKNKQIMELIMTKLADKLYNATLDSNLDPNVDIIEYVRLLDINQNDGFVQNTSWNLKRYLQNLNIFEKMLEHKNAEDEFLVAYIDIWLKYIPFDVKLVKNFESHKEAFVELVKCLRFWGANEDVQKEEIITFLMSLPLTNKSEQFLNEEANKFLHNLTLMTIGNVSRNFSNRSDENIRSIVRDWCTKLPLTSDYNSKELQYVIDNMTTQIIKLIIVPEYNYTDENLRKEIINNLTKFPLSPAYNSSNPILQMANDLIAMFKDIRHETTCNVAVYGVSLKNNTTAGTDNSIQSIKDDDIKSNLDDYAKQLVGQINEWLHNLEVPDTKDQSFKEVVINDLAGDIIDRHKYLELNPASRGTNEEELSHLKYQIFKWINKLVGEHNLVTIEHASDLMNRIQSVPVPMLLKPHGKILMSPSESIQSRSIKHSQNVVTNSNDNKSSSSIKESIEVKVPPNIGSGTSSGNYKEQQHTSSPGDLGFATAPRSVSKSSQNEILRQTESNPDESATKAINTQNQANTLQKIYDKYQKIFIAKANEIVNAAIPNDKALAAMAITGIYKGILKGFFSIKSNPDVENDYPCFEFMLEDKVNELIDLLPQTAELDRIKHNWKINVLINAVDMLKEMHGVTDRPNFRQQLTKKLNRKALKELEDKECFGLQQAFIVEMVNDYILETQYKQDDPIKSNIYKQRLMKNLDDFANHITKKHNLVFKHINRSAFKRLAMKVLDEVPIPAHDILQEEVEEILLAEEIQQWYKELPVYPYINDMDMLLRKRLMEILAKKLNEIDKNMPRDDPSKERLMKHEMTIFLERKGWLKRDEDLNINFMVDELNNRLKNRWVDTPVEYGAFDKDKPISSTFARFENDEILPPVEAVRGSVTDYTQSYGMPNDYRPDPQLDGVESKFQSCSPNCQSRDASDMIRNPANTSQQRSHNIGDNFPSEVQATVEGNSPGYQALRRQDNSDRNSYIESNEARGYTARRNEMSQEDERLRMRCKCKRRRYVCYDCDEDYHRYVPCPYYF